MGTLILGTLDSAGTGPGQDQKPLLERAGALSLVFWERETKFLEQGRDVRFARYPCVTTAACRRDSRVGRDREEFTQRPMSGAPGKGLERLGLGLGWKQGAINQEGCSRNGFSRLSLVGS